MTRKRWRKSWEEKWRDEASDLLDLPARALRALLGDVAELEDGSDVGWAVDGRGLAYDRPRLARLLAATAEQVDGAVGQLVRAGVAVEVDGRLGLVGWRDSQEDPSAKRVRQHRERAAQRDDGRYSNAASNAEETPRGQRTEDRGQISSSSNDTPASPPAPAPTLGRRIALARESMGYGQALISRRTGIAPATLRAIEADEVDPTADEIALLARHIGDPTLAAAPALRVDTGVAETAGELHDARASLGAVEPRPVVTGDVAREFWAPAKAGLVLEGMTLVEAWRVVIRRATEEARRNAEDGRGGRDLEFLTLRSLGGATRWRRYLGNSDLDRRREADSQGQRARASPPGAHVVVTKGRKYVDGNPLASK